MMKDIEQVLKGELGNGDLLGNIYARKANVDVSATDRYKVIEVRDNLNTCYKYLTKKETQSVVNYVVTHYKDNNDSTSMSVVLEALKHEVNTERVRMNEHDMLELSNAIAEIAVDVIADSIYLSIDYMMKFRDYFTLEETREFLCSIEDGKVIDVELLNVKDDEDDLLRTRVRLMNGRDSDYTICTMDVYAKDGYEYFSPMIYEKSTGYVYFRHLSEQFEHLDTHRLSFDGFTTPYSRKKFDTLYNLYMSGRGMSPVLCDLRFHTMLMCMTAYSNFCKAEKKEIRVRSESMVKSKVDKEIAKVRGIDKTEFGITLVDKRTSIEDILTRKVYEKKPWQGGHHASPCEHTRKGYWRRRSKKDDSLIWIDSCIVNPSGKSSKINLDTVIM